MLSTMQELFVDELRDLYDAEKQLTKALSDMADAASTKELSSAFTNHLGETEGHLRRLEQIFESMNEKSGGKKCAAMAGLIKESNELIDDNKESPVRDAALIAAAQKVEHYEMSGYGSARAHARLLGNNTGAQLLEQTLEEEKAADTKLNEIAQTLINEEALVTSGSGIGLRR